MLTVLFPLFRICISLKHLFLKPRNFITTPTFCFLSHTHQHTKKFLCKTYLHWEFSMAQAKEGALGWGAPDTRRGVTPVIRDHGCARARVCGGLDVLSVLTMVCMEHLLILFTLPVKISK